MEIKDKSATRERSKSHPLKPRRLIMPLALAALMTLLIAGTAIAVGVDRRVSTDSSGAQVNGSSMFPVLSKDGRFLAFESQASNLESGDNNSTTDVFMKETQTDVVKRLSVSSTGVEGNSQSAGAAISADGRYVAFYSAASNLLGINGDTNGKTDVFVRDTTGGGISRASISIYDTEVNNDSSRPDISADGRYVAFQSLATNFKAVFDAENDSDIFVRDTQSTPKITKVSTPYSGGSVNGSSYDAAISADGRYVAFYSTASNLIAGDTEGKTDIFIRDWQQTFPAAEIKRVSLAYGSPDTGANENCFSPDISADGRYVVFYSSASNLLAPGGDTNGFDDIYIRETQAGKTSRVSTASDGAQGNGASRFPSISDDGRYVTFQSEATNLVPGDSNLRTDVFVKDVLTGVTTRLSTDQNGVQGNNSSNYPSISADGSIVAFNSDASNLVTGDSNNVKDIFLASVSHTYYFTWYDNSPANFMKGNWIVVNNEDVTAATVDIYIGGSRVVNGAAVQPGSSYPWQSPTAITSGPVKVVSRNGQKLGVSQRVLFKDSFNEVEGIKSTELKSEYYFPWYDNSPANFMGGDWVIVANMGNEPATVQIYVGNMATPIDTVPVGPGGIVPWQAPNTITNGPVLVKGTSSDDKLVVSQRVLFKDSFNEAMGIATENLESEAWFTWYDNSPANFMGGNWVCIANAGDTDTTVDIFVGGAREAWNLPVSGNGGHVEWQSPVPLTKGPVQVRGKNLDDRLVVSQRILFKDSFEETAPTYLGQMGSNADFTWYDNNPANFMGGNWVMVANAGAYIDNVDIKIAGAPAGTINGINASWGQEFWSSPTYVTAGPVRVTNNAVGGDQLIISQRVIYKNSFNELVGRPR